MVVLIGFIIVCGSVVGGLHLGGGSVMVLMHLSEFVAVVGICAGVLVIASPMSVLKDVAAKTITAFKGGPIPKGAHMEGMKMMFHLFILARKEGLMILEEHLVDPKNSEILKKYPTFLKNDQAVMFVVDALQPLVDGRIKPELLRPIMATQLASMKDEARKPVGILHLVGDSFPGIGICAAVLGIILTMGSIAQGPEVVGYKVAAALTGTFLGVFGAYGFVNPLAVLIEANNEAEQRYFNMIAEGIGSYAAGLAPQLSVEFARRTLLSSERPSSVELEAELKEVKIG